MELQVNFGRDEIIVASKKVLDDVVSSIRLDNKAAKFMREVSQIFTRL